VVTNWDGLDAKAFAGIYNSNWVCSVVMYIYFKPFILSYVLYGAKRRKQLLHRFGLSSARTEKEKNIMHGGTPSAPSITPGHKFFFVCCKKRFFKNVHGHTIFVLGSFFYRCTLVITIKYKF
jgi:hypothetical protein